MRRFLELIERCCMIEGKFYQSPDMLAEFFYLREYK